jgi:serine protease Do
LTTGKVVRGWLGVTIQEVSPEMAKELGLPTHRGVLIADVDPRGPAQKAGLKRGDLVVKINGKRVDSTARLRNLVASAGSGKSASLELYRNRKLRTVRVKLGELPAQLGRRGTVPAPAQQGLTVAPLDSQSRRTFDVPRRIRQGVVLVRVDPNGPAASSGLQRGDVILEVNRSRIKTVEQFYRAYGAAKERVLLLVFRKGSTIYMLVTK